MHNDLQLLIDAAHQAGDIARKHFRADPQVWEKDGGQGPVTEADIAIDNMLHEDLRAARPEAGWLSEEIEDTKERLEHDTVFIVDPIDGTRSFLHGKPTFAHALAIAHKGDVQSAVVYLPMLDLCFAAQKGEGATLNGTPLQLDQGPDLTDARVLGQNSLLKPENWRDGEVLIREVGFEHSLAYRMCLVSNGTYDVMVTLRDAWEWDAAAGDLIIAEAGGIVTTAEFGETRYNNPHPQLPGLVAASPAPHATLAQTMRRVIIPR